jgi:hypothetical protein
MSSENPILAGTQFVSTAAGSSREAVGLRLAARAYQYPHLVRVVPRGSGPQSICALRESKHVHRRTARKQSVHSDPEFRSTTTNRVSNVTQILTQGFSTFPEPITLQSRVGNWRLLTRRRRRAQSRTLRGYGSRFACASLTVRYETGLT